MSADVDLDRDCPSFTLPKATAARPLAVSEAFSIWLIAARDSSAAVDA
jgi:hypothetical protein